MSRLSELQSRLADEDFDAYFITDAVNVGYLTGFTGDESALLVAPERAWFITDSRFSEQVKSEVTDAEIVLHTKGLAAQAGQLADQFQLEKIGFEAAHTTYADFMKLPKTVHWEATTNLVESQREVKNDQEVALIQRAIDIAMAGYEHVLATIKPGMTELEIATDLDFFMRRLGASGVSFETIVASGPRSAMPHGAATTREIQVGEVVTLDWGAIYQGYVSDVTRTFAIGTVDPKIEEIYRIVYAANQGVTAMTKPGVTGRAINDYAHEFIDAAGYGEYFGHGTGHGIGLSIHEGPGAWGQYLDVGQAVGNVETNEPGIYLPGVGGVRIEDDLLITSGGNRQLTPAAPAEILVVPVNE